MSRVGGASEPGGVKCCRSPNQGPPDLSMGRVSAAGQSYALRCLPQPARRGSSYLDKILEQVCTNCIFMNNFTLVCTISALDGKLCTLIKQCA